VVLRGPGGRGQAGGQAPAADRGCRRRARRHGLLELHRLYQEVPDALSRKRPPAQPGRIRRRQGPGRLGVACGRSHSLLPGARGQTGHLPRPLPRLARSRPSETASGAAASDAGCGVR
jgi:hypothetical protein